MWENTYRSLSIIFLQTLAEFSVYLPKIVAALAVFLIGAAVAGLVRHFVTKTLDAVKLSKTLSGTPIDHFVKNTEITHRIEKIIGSIVYWLIMIVIIQSSIAILGLTPLSIILEKLLSFIPHILSAIIILFFAVLLSGLVESLVKGGIKSIDPKTGRVLGKLSSYLVLTIGVLISFSELGIASDFILILFIGFIGSVSLGLGLALGLGGKDLVGRLLENYYKKNLSDK